MRVGQQVLVRLCRNVITATVLPACGESPSDVGVEADAGVDVCEYFGLWRLDDQSLDTEPRRMLSG